MTTVSLDVVAFDRATKALLQVADRFDRLADKADKLDRKRVNMRADADTRKAERALDALDRKASKLDNTQFAVKVDGEKTLNVLSLISAGLAAIGHLAPAAVGAVAAAPAAIGVLAQGAGALIVSLSGVGDGVSALTAAEEGLAQGGAAAMAAQAKLDAELDKLSPSARSLAEALHGEVLPALRGIRDGVQSTALPRFEVALKNLLQLSPEVNAGLSETGKVVGDLAVRGSAMMTTGPWRSDFAKIMASNNRSLDSFGTAGLHALDSVRSLTVAGGPLIERFAAATEHGAELANQFIQDARASGQLDEFMRKAGDTLAEFGQTALQVVVGVTQLAVALGPLGGIVLDIVGGVVQFVGAFASAHPVITQVAAGAILATTVITKLGTVVAGLVATAGVARAGLATLLGAFESVHTRTNRAIGALSVGRTAAEGFAAGLGGSASAADRAATSKGRLSGAVTSVGGKLGALGIVLAGLGLAYSNVSGNVDDATQAIAAGGDAAIAKVRELQAVDQEAEAHGFGNWIGFLSEKLGLATPGLEAMRGKLDAVGQAQLRAAEAMVSHQNALVQYGPGTVQAADASRVLDEAVRTLEQEQLAAAAATDSHTQALVALQNTMFLQADKDLAFRESLLAVERAQRATAEATKSHAAGSFEVREALTQEEGALQRSVLALGEKVRAENAAMGETEANRLATEAMNGRLYELISAAGNTAPVLLRMAANMSDADLRARGATVSVNHLGQRVVALPNGKTIIIEAETAGAQQRLNRFIDANDGRTIHIYTQMSPSGVPIRQLGGGAMGGIDIPRFAEGGVAAMARGGRLTPMSGRYAKVVHPNTWRIIGDRMRGNESFIPWDGSRRSLEILERTARAMGYALAPLQQMGSGGMVRAEDGSMVPASFYGKRPGGPAPLDVILAEASARAAARHAAEAAAGEMAQIRAVITTLLAALSSGVRVDWRGVALQIGNVQRVNARR